MGIEWKENDEEEKNETTILPAPIGTYAIEESKYKGEWTVWISPVWAFKVEIDFRPKGYTMVGKPRAESTDVWLIPICGYFPDGYANASESSVLFVGTKEDCEKRIKELEKEGAKISV